MVIPTFLNKHQLQTVLKLMGMWFYQKVPKEVTLSMNSHLCVFRKAEQETEQT